MMKPTILSRAHSLASTLAVFLTLVLTLSACDSEASPSDVAQPAFADSKRGQTADNTSASLSCPDPVRPELEINLAAADTVDVFFELGLLSSQEKIHACFEAADNFLVVLTYTPQSRVSFRFIPKNHPFAHIWDIREEYLLDNVNLNRDNVIKVGEGAYEASALPAERPSSVHFSRETKGGSVLYTKRFDYNRGSDGQLVDGGTSFTDYSNGNDSFNATDLGFGYTASTDLKFNRVVLISDADIILK